MAATTAKQYGPALVGTHGTPSSTNKYVTDSDPRFDAAEETAEDVAALETQALTINDLAAVVRWLHARVKLLEAVNGTAGAFTPPEEAALFEVDDVGD